jgi:hypothetical protein
MIVLMQNPCGGELARLSEGKGDKSTWVEKNYAFKIAMMLNVVWLLKPCLRP